MSRLAAALPMLLLGACASRTEIVVALSTDLRPEEIDRVALRIVQASHPPLILEWNAAGPGAIGTFGILPGKRDIARSLLVTVTGSLKGVERLSRRARLPFAAGRVLRLSMALLYRCLGIECGADQTCTEQGCRAFHLLTDDLPSYDDPQPPVDSGVDGQARPTLCPPPVDLPAGRRRDVDLVVTDREVLLLYGGGVPIMGPVSILSHTHLGGWQPRARLPQACASACSGLVSDGCCPKGCDTPSLVGWTDPRADIDCNTAGAFAAAADDAGALHLVFAEAPSVVVGPATKHTQWTGTGWSPRRELIGAPITAGRVEEIAFAKGAGGFYMAQTSADGLRIGRLEPVGSALEYRELHKEDATLCTFNGPLFLGGGPPLAVAMGCLDTLDRTTVRLWRAPSFASVPISPPSFASQLLGLAATTNGTWVALAEGADRPTARVHVYEVTSGGIAPAETLVGVELWSDQRRSMSGTAFVGPAGTLFFALHHRSAMYEQRRIYKRATPGTWSIVHKSAAVPAPEDPNSYIKAVLHGPLLHLLYRTTLQSSRYECLPLP